MSISYKNHKIIFSIFCNVLNIPKILNSVFWDFLNSFCETFSCLFETFYKINHNYAQRPMNFCCTMFYIYSLKCTLKVLSYASLSNYYLDSLICRILSSRYNFVNYYGNMHWLHKAHSCDFF